MKATILMMLTVFAGFVCGLERLLPPLLLNNSERLIEYGLYVLLFGIGVDIGRNKKVLKNLRNVGPYLVCVPAGVILGTLAGSMLLPLFTSLKWNEALAVASGFGWYSLSGILLTKFHGAELGAVAFLSNIMRELITIVSIPLLARYCGPLTTIAPGGATTMDTTLPIIARHVGRKEITLIAFWNGLVLSALVPVLVPFFIKLG